MQAILTVCDTFRKFCSNVINEKAEEEILPGPSISAIRALEFCDGACIIEASTVIIDTATAADTGKS